MLKVYFITYKSWHSWSAQRENIAFLLIEAAKPFVIFGGKKLR